MEERPNLDTLLDSQTFQEFYYLKEKFVEFCRKNRLSTSGNKKDLTNRIIYFLETGKVINDRKYLKKKVDINNITEDTLIETPFVCSQKHRLFFKEKKNKKIKIDSQFEYNTYIRDFFDDNQGRSLNEAIQCWKYKKSIRGHNRYEKTDLERLEKEV